MGRKSQEKSPLRYVVKNSFIHIVDELDDSVESVLLRPRAVSEFTGTRMATEEGKQLWQFPAPCTEVQEDSDSHLVDVVSPLQNLEGSRRVSDADIHTKSVDVSSIRVSDADIRTTVMMRNIPNAYTSESFAELFNTYGFLGLYDFVYLPIDFRTGVNLGYAFVNFVSHQDAQSFKDCFDGFQQWCCKSPKVCEVSWTDPHQGLREHVERYRNSPVMHEDVSDIYKPRVYAGGKRMPFPGPTKRIRPPRIRPQKRLARDGRDARESSYRD